MAHGRSPRSHRLNNGPIHKAGVLRGVGGTGPVKEYKATPEEVEALLQQTKSVSTKQERGKWPSAVIIKPASTAVMITENTISKGEETVLRPKDLSAEKLKQHVKQGDSLEAIKERYGFGSDQYFKTKIKEYGYGHLVPDGRHGNGRRTGQVECPAVNPDPEQKPEKRAEMNVLTAGNADIWSELQALAAEPEDEWGELFLGKEAAPATLVLEKHGRVAVRGCKIDEAQTYAIQPTKDWSKIRLVPHVAGKKATRKDATIYLNSTAVCKAAAEHMELPVRYRFDPETLIGEVMDHESVCIAG